MLDAAQKTHLRDYIDEKWDSFSRFCIDSIERGYYIFATINTTYISDYGWSGRHQIFIHGYNYDTEMFLCSDFFGENAKYCRRWISADKLNLAYKRLADVSPIDDLGGETIYGNMTLTLLAMILNTVFGIRLYWTYVMYGIFYKNILMGSRKRICWAPRKYFMESTFMMH